MSKKGFDSDLVIIDEGVTMTKADLLADGWVEMGAIKEDGIEHTSQANESIVWPNYGGVQMKTATVLHSDDFTVGWKTNGTDATPHPSGRTDLVAQIDKLISEEKCPHCNRDWHESVLTQRVWNMYQRGRTDPHYFARQDASPILCLGSRAIGPSRPPGFTSAPGTLSVKIVPNPGLSAGETFADPFKGLSGIIAQMSDALAGLNVKANPWLPGMTNWCDQILTPSIKSPCSDPIIEFGSQNWKYEFRRVPGQPQWAGQQDLFPELPIAEMLVFNDWKSFIPKVELPPTPKSNWSRLDVFVPKKYPSTKGIHHEG